MSTATADGAFDGAFDGALLNQAPLDRTLLDRTLLDRTLLDRTLLARALARALPDPLPAIEPPRRVLVAGHDLRFFAAIREGLEAAGHAVASDRWDSHDRHDEASSRRLLDWAEVIVCEWCLGNAVWYARHRRPDQRLVVHFHRFEFDTEFPPRLEIGAVDAVVFAGPHFRRAAIERFGWPAERCVYVPNGVDVGRFEHPKTTDARFTLGLLGYHRRLKRLDVALDVLARLRADDERFRLVAKGQRPDEVDWVWNDDEERAYFEQQFRRLEEDAALSGAVTFEGYDDRVVTWFSSVGFILSPSDVESFHLAAIEGMASGAVPIVRERPGVGEIFPQRWIFAGEAEMARFIAATAEGDRWEDERRRAHQEVTRRYGLGAVMRAWRSIVLGVPPSELSDRTRIDARISTRTGTRIGTRIGPDRISGRAGDAPRRSEDAAGDGDRGAPGR